MLKNTCTVIFFLCLPAFGCSPAGASTRNAPTDPSSNQTAFNDCRDTSLSCYAPFTCEKNPELDSTVAPDPDGPSEYVCDSTKALGVPSCKGNPSKLAVFFATSFETNIPLHWLPDQRCIPVTYDPSVASKKQEITEAISAINQVPGLSVCLDGPTLRTADPSFNRSERLVHIRLGDPAGDELRDPNGGTYLANASNYFERDTGRIFGGLIVIHPDKLAPVTAGVMLRHLSVMLGMAGTQDPELCRETITCSNVTEFMFDELLTKPSSLDIEALQHMYGSAPYCE